MGYTARIQEPLIPMPFLKLVIAYKLYHLPPKSKIDVRELTLEDCETAWEYTVNVGSTRA